MSEDALERLVRELARHGYPVAELATPQPVRYINGIVGCRSYTVGDWGSSMNEEIYVRFYGSPLRSDWIVRRSLNTRTEGKDELLCIVLNSGQGWEFVGEVEGRLIVRRPWDKVIQKALDGATNEKEKA